MLLRKIFNVLFVRPILKSKLESVGDNFRFGYSSNLESPQSFSIGDNFFSGPYGYFSSNKDTRITIGSNVMFGPYCKVIGGNHNTTWPYGPMMNAPYLGRGKGIVIEDDAWIGAGATLLDGSFLAEGSVLASGAVLTGNTKPYSVYAGVPARFLKFRFTKDEIKKIESSTYTQLQIQSIYE